MVHYPYSTVEVVEASHKRWNEQADRARALGITLETWLELNMKAMHDSHIVYEVDGHHIRRLATDILKELIDEIEVGEKK